MAQEKMRIAVMDFEGKDIPAKDAVKYTELIRNDIVNTGRFIVIERSQMGQILKEQGFQQTGCTDVSCAVEMGKMLSAKKILVGSIMKIGDEVIITGRIVDVEKGTVEFSEKAGAANTKEIVTAVSTFVEKLAGRMGNSDMANADKKPVKKEDVKPAKAEEPSYSNPYSGKMLLSLAFTGVFFGGGYYFETQVADKTNEMSDLQNKYNSSNVPAEITVYKNQWSSAKDEGDKLTLYRNISYGLSGITALVSIYYIYQYATYTPSAKSISFNEEKAVTIYPIMAVFNNKNNPGSESFYGCGATFKF